jgi:hypothetical protein
MVAMIEIGLLIAVAVVGIWRVRRTGVYRATRKRDPAVADRTTHGSDLDGSGGSYIQPGSGGGHEDRIRGLGEFKGHL